MQPLEGKVILVTGASSGIGAVTATTLARAGARLVLTARRAEQLHTTAGDITAAGAESLSVPCDITDAAQVDRLFDETSERFGRLDVLINNAGVMLLARHERGLLDEWRQMSDVNVHALYYAAYKAVEPMRRAGGGHIVNVSSTAARGPRLMNGAYAGTKAAVTAMSESLRQELIPDNIRVTLITPGAVETDLPSHVTDDEARNALGGLLKMKRLQPQDVANAVLYTVTQPDYVSVSEIVLRPTQQPF